MTDGNRSSYFLEADEIDHLTIRFTDFGENLNKEKASFFIRKYLSKYSVLKEMTCLSEIDDRAIRSLEDKELYEILVKIRTYILDIAFA